MTEARAAQDDAFSGLGEVRFVQRRSRAAKVFVFSAVSVVYGVFWIQNPGEMELGVVDPPDTVAFVLAAWMVLYFLPVGMRAARGLIRGSTGVVLTPSGVQDLTPLLAMPRSRTYARWDQIIGVRVAKTFLLKVPVGECLVLELRDRRPVRIGLDGFKPADAARLCDEVARRLRQHLGQPEFPT